MERKRHKRKNNHVVIVTSDAVDANVKQYKFRSWLPRVLLWIFCLVLGVAIGYYYFENTLWQERRQEVAEQQEYENGLLEQIDALTQSNAELQEEVKSLNNTIRLLSDTVKTKTKNEEQLMEQIEKQYMPKEFPLTGAATMEVDLSQDPICVFSTSVGGMVVATAGGTVTAVNDETEYGHNVWIDHGNGYVTVYHNAGEVKVRQGETVMPGTTLFIITEDGQLLGYQMLKDGSYINPMELLAISG